MVEAGKLRKFVEVRVGEGDFALYSLVNERLHLEEAALQIAEADAREEVAGVARVGDDAIQERVGLHDVVAYGTVGERGHKEALVKGLVGSFLEQPIFGGWLSIFGGWL